MHLESSVFYQIYPLNFCGAPEHNTFDFSAWNGAAQPSENRFVKIEAWIPHLKQIGADAVYFNPIFQSDKHGYDTRDYYTIDSRLGSNHDFARLCSCLHQAGIRVIIDGVFNHVGRGFWAFRDVQKNQQNSAYKDWFFIDWTKNSADNDGFYYEGWEGCYDLVKLNLKNPDVKTHIFGALQKWVSLFHIDGLRLDVAYSLDRTFLSELRSLCSTLPDSYGKNEFVLIGETIYGKDYTAVSNTLLHACTNYELYKALYSSCNDRNMFELSWTLKQQQNLYSPLKMMTFCDNHDVTRIASILKTNEHLPLVYGLLFALPGFPCIYYGSEWGIQGKKECGDNDLRPYLSEYVWNGLTGFVSRLAHIRKDSKALTEGSFRELCVMNGQYIFERTYTDSMSGQKERIIAAVNAEPREKELRPVHHGHGVFEGIRGQFINIFTGSTVTFHGSITLPPYSVQYFKDCV